ncbi:MAG TPA: hypothetical protein DEP63_05185 [Candidatus Magasanikbacteria bacterium]|nr:hypothetical protein [Candidatus Magasanikbacteria bacterium]HCC14105.1 hypothetical protein [Candidatus Magasanikbacteria bacterium]
MSILEQLLKQGLVSQEQAVKAAIEIDNNQGATPAVVVHSDEESYGSGRGITPSTRTMDEFEKGVLEWAAAAIELLGKERLVAALDRALEGTNRARTAFDNLIERQIEAMPRSQAESWRSRLPNLGGRKGCPTFCGQAEEVLDAITSGSAEQFAEEQRKTQLQADKLVWPEIEDGEEGDSYRDRLDAWAADKPEKLLKAARFDSYEISRRVQEKRETAQRQREVEMSRKAIEAFNQTGDYVALAAFYESLGQRTIWTGMNSGTSPEYIAGESKFAWQLVAAGHITPGHVKVEPTAEWLEEQEDIEFLIRCAREASSDYRNMFREQLLLVLPETPDETHAYIKGELVITHKGEIIKPEKYMWSGEGFRHVGAGSVQPGYLISTIPHPDGWVTIRSVKEWNGTKLQATLYSSVNFSALETALRCEKGTFDVRAWLANFGRHPQKGFGRFYFRVQPGGASWDQMFVSVDDRLRDRIELLMQLPDPEDVAFPENVWHLPARLVSKKDKGGHLVWDESNRQGMIAWKRGASWVQMSRRSSGSFISHRSTGTAAAWSLSASTNKHNHTMVVALIGEGEELHLDSGIAVRNNGGKLDEVAGGALKPEEKLGA